jgi:hypothetical protein
MTRATPLEAPTIADKILEAAKIGSLWFALVTAIPYLATAWFIHLRGRTFLREIKSEEDIKIDGDPGNS